MALTSTSEYTRAGESPEAKRALEHLIEEAGARGDVARALINRLFPAGLRHTENHIYGPEYLSIWLRARRVADIDILRLYLERVASEGLAAFSDAERAFGMLGDELALSEFLQSIDDGRRQDVIAALENYEGDYPPESVPVAVVVLLNLLPTLPERQGGLFTTDARLAVTRVVLRLLKQLEGPDEVEGALDDILPSVKTLSSQFELVHLVGHQENSGHKLVSKEAAEQLEADLVKAIHATPPDALTDEWNVLRILWWASHTQPDDAVHLQPNDNLQLNAQLLLQARSEMRSQPFGSRVVKLAARLLWDPLVVVYGTEEKLAEAIEATKQVAEHETQLADVIELAERYLTGWRPKEF